MTYDVVIPTTGRASLGILLAALGGGAGPLPGHVLVVDDRPAPAAPLQPALAPLLADRTVVLRAQGRGPAAARNLGWRAADAEWVVFLDDDVLPAPDWRAALAADIAAAGPAAATQGRIRVLHSGAHPDDWERSVRGLDRASWATADMAYRRAVLARTGGFDERFPRAYREDADLGLRVIATGDWIVRGQRQVEHPVAPAPWWQSLRRQRGNADDALMLLIHGPGWERRAGTARGMRRRHLATTGLLAVGLLAAARRRRNLSAAALGGWLMLTAGLAWSRILPGPQSPREVAAMGATSIAIPPLACWWWLAGLVRARRLTRRPAAVLFDRDGTLIEDVPYNNDPDRVRPLPGAAAALERVRRAGIPVGIVSNQSGVARGLLEPDLMGAVNQRVDELLGPFDAFCVCTHGPGAGCECRKPGPGLVLAAARRLGVVAARCAVIGDIESDLEAARRAGARGVMVPNAATQPSETTRAREVAAGLEAAVALLLGPA